MAQLLPFRPMSGFYLKDDFYQSDAITTGLIGELDWELTHVGAGGTESYLITTNAVPGRPGILRFLPAGAAGDGTAYHLDIDGIVLNGNSGSASCGVRIPDIAGNLVVGSDFRFGLGDSVTATANTVGIWLCITDGVVAMEMDSADHGDNRSAAAGCSALDGGTTMEIGEWYDFELRWSAENAQGGPARGMLYVNGVPAFDPPMTCEIDDDEEMEFGFRHWNAGATTLEWDLDYVDILIKGRG